MKKYRTWLGEIEEIDVIRETDKFVYKNSERRDAKRSDRINYFDTWTEARDFLIDREKAAIDRARDEIDQHMEKLAKIMEMKPHVERD